MSRTIAIANQKGGVGKTTTTFNLGHGLAEKGEKVLKVDLDPQSSLSICQSLEIQSLKASIYDVLIQAEDPAKISEVAVPTELPNLQIVPSSIQLASAEIELNSEFSRETILKRALREAISLYDFILIDCPPSLGFLTINALAAADEVIIPIASDYLALCGANLLLKTINKIQHVLNSDLCISGVLVTMFDGRTTHSKEILSEIRRLFGNLVYDSIIPFTVRAKEAPVLGSSILNYQPRSKVAHAYRSLTEEVIRNGK